MKEITTSQAVAILKMPVDMFAQWCAEERIYPDGYFAEIKHPKFKVNRGGRRTYIEADILNAKAILGKENHFRTFDDGKGSEWTNKRVREHGANNLLAMAVKSPVQLVTKRQGTFTIAVTEDIQPGAGSATEIIGRRYSDIIKYDRIENTRMFPGVQFTVERVE